MSCATGDATLQNESESIFASSVNGFDEPENFPFQQDSGKEFEDPFKVDLQQLFGGMIVRCHVRV